MAAVANAMFDGPAIVEPIPADFLRPGKYDEQLARAYHGAEIILDFSASVAVSRHLSAGESKGRSISAFLIPSGKALVIAAEDVARTFRLDWLEMLHYRAVLNEAQLRDSFQSPGARLRYGNSCRDISTAVPSAQASTSGCCSCFANSEPPS